MDSEHNGNKPEVQMEDHKVFHISVTWDVFNDAYTVRGLEVPVWVALGMLEYMTILVKRRDVENTIRATQAAAPIIAMPGRRV